MVWLGISSQILKRRPTPLYFSAMNFTTHVMFGLLVGAIFFGKPEIIILIGIGSAIPDMDREYGFFRRDSFRDKQIHRALFHNFISIGILYLINPFLGIGAFLHTLLDALTTAKDRGIEWLFPFTRLVKHALYDEEMRKLNVPPNKKIVFYQNDLIADARKSDQDLQETKPVPWRRTYGPALSSRLLDQGVGVGSLFLFIYLLVLSGLGIHQFIDLSASHIPSNVAIPLVIGAAGIVVELLSGELDRRRSEMHKERHPIVYHVLFYVSLALMVLAVAIGAVLSPAYVNYVVFGELPYIIGGAIVAFAAASFILLVRPHRRIKKEAANDPSII
jgi:hypothetical protein